MSGFVRGAGNGVIATARPGADGVCGHGLGSTAARKYVGRRAHPAGHDVCGCRDCLAPRSGNKGRAAALFLRDRGGSGVVEERGIGPELSQMAGMHPPEFFAESIISPNAVIDPDAKKLGYVGEDGKSKMPDYNSVLTTKQVIDLAAYVGSLKAQKSHDKAGQ